MPLVKILLSQDYTDDDYFTNIIRDSITDWEEISAEELSFLRGHLYDILGGKSNYWDMKPILLVKDEIPARVRIDNLKQFIKDREAKLAEARKIKAAKKRERDKKRKEEQEAKDLARFEELRKRLGV
jgi:hypothetical protein